MSSQDLSLASSALLMSQWDQGSKSFQTLMAELEKDQPSMFSYPDDLPELPDHIRFAGFPSLDLLHVSAHRGIDLTAKDPKTGMTLRETVSLTAEASLDDVVKALASVLERDIEDVMDYVESTYVDDDLLRSEVVTEVAGYQEWTIEETKDYLEEKENKDIFRRFTAGKYGYYLVLAISSILAVTVFDQAKTAGTEEGAIRWDSTTSSEMQGDVQDFTVHRRVVQKMFKGAPKVSQNVERKVDDSYLMKMWQKEFDRRAAYNKLIIDELIAKESTESQTGEAKKKTKKTTSTDTDSDLDSDTESDTESDTDSDPEPPPLPISARIGPYKKPVEEDDNDDAEEKTANTTKTLAIPSLSKLKIGDQVSFKYINGEIVKGKVETTGDSGASVPYITLEKDPKYYFDTYVQRSSILLFLLP